jgi:phenylpropionate dioxygenase-like ring-hydroxylating dioxygenase large terminal subunit
MLNQKSQTRPETSVPRDLLLGLRGYWYPVATSEDIPTEKPVPLRRLGENLVAWRDGSGTVSVLIDRCPHRGARLSIGDVIDGRLQCRYHGLQYDATGQCRYVPAEGTLDGRQARHMCCTTRHGQEAAGLVWAYFPTSAGEDPPPLVLEPELTDPTHASIVWMSEWNANWLLVHDNTCDPAHVPFLHGHFVSHPDNGEVRVEKMADGNPIVTEEGFGGLIQGAYTAKTSDTKVLVELKDRAQEASNEFGEVCFTLPCLASVYVPLPDGGPPVRLHQYELPMDEHTTVVFAWAGRPAPAEAQDATTAFLKEGFIPLTSMVFSDDSWIVENQPDVDEAWASENLLSIDIGPPRVRKLIRTAYEQTDSRGRVGGVEASHAQ